MILYAIAVSPPETRFTQGNPVRSYYSRFPCEMQVVFHGKQKNFFSANRTNPLVLKGWLFCNMFQSLPENGIDMVVCEGIKDGLSLSAAADKAGLL